MMIPFGILSAAGVSGEVPSDYELISTTTLGTATSSVTFSSLGDYLSTYKHLQIRAVFRSSRGELDSPLDVRWNGITSGYFSHELRGYANAVSSSGGTGGSYMRLAYGPASSAASNAFGATVIDILDAYSTTKNKTFRALYGDTGVQILGLSSASVANTSSTTSITLLDNFGNLVAGSRFSLYGIKG
jgi:hypothetical protein